MGYADLCRDKIAPDHPIRNYLNEITCESERSANLTRQLLAFARKQTIAPRVLDLNDAVAGMLKLLRRLIGEDIKLALRPGMDLWPVSMDPGQVDQILANLCVNARDAIGGVGEVNIATGNVCVDESMALRYENYLPGDYVLLTVADTGCGMDQETQNHIFEPFFTTKQVGHGTGLGLATVYGIVKQNKGHIGVYSEPGHGTIFRISLPRYLGADFAQSTDSPAKTPVRGCETVMLVEDEQSVLTMIERSLRGLGYTVLAAGTPHDALRLVAEYAGEIQLLVTDVVMPGMNGRELSEQLKERYPHLKCLFMSGYTADIIERQGVLDKGINFIQKPFPTVDLSVKMREILAGA